MKNSKLVLIFISALSLAACSQTNFSSPAEGQLGASSNSPSSATYSDSGSSSSSGPSYSYTGQSALPKTSCVSSSKGSLAFKLESDITNNFQIMRMTSMPTSPKGDLIGYTVHDNGSGTLHYEDQSMEAFIDDESDDFFYKCVVAYSEIVAFAQRKGIASLPAAIPRLTLELWLPDDAAKKGKIVGVALENPQTKEFAVQCF